MALFGEKYGDWVRVVEVEGVSRELCGGTHVANTAEVGIFKIVSEGSSAANVRRIEALTGPAAIDWYRERAEELGEAGEVLGTPQDPVGAAPGVRPSGLESRAKERDRRARRPSSASRPSELAATAEDVGGVKLSSPPSADADQEMLLDLANRIRSSLGDSAVVLGGADDGKVALVGAASADAAVERGLSAAAVVREAAAVVGGGGGGRDDMAQAGGKDPSKLDEALAAARQAIEPRSSAERRGDADPRPRLRQRPHRLRGQRSRAGRWCARST